MYIGSTSERGLHHLVWEIVDNSIDEALAGFATDIEITIEKNNIIRVEDNGRGMPTGIVEKTGISGVETIFTVPVSYTHLHTQNYRELYKRYQQCSKRIDFVFAVERLHFLRLLHLGAVIGFACIFRLNLIHFRLNGLHTL